MLLSVHYILYNYYIIAYILYDYYIIIIVLAIAIAAGLKYNGAFSAKQIPQSFKQNKF